jgi:hypothetical protein
MMITQYQARKLAQASGFEQLDLIKDMIKSLEAQRDETRAQLIAEGEAYLDVRWRDDYVTKGHWVRTFKPVK